MSKNGAVASTKHPPTSSPRGLAGWRARPEAQTPERARASGGRLEDIAALLRKRLGKKEPLVVLHTLVLVEVLVKNCGPSLHTVIGTKSFLGAIGKMIRVRPVPGWSRSRWRPAVTQTGTPRGPAPRPRRPLSAQKWSNGTRDQREAAMKGAELIQSWGEAFLPKRSRYPHAAVFVDTYHDLATRGVRFPRQYDRTRVPVFTPEGSHDVEGPAAASAPPRSSSGDSVVSNMVDMLREMILAAESPQEITGTDTIGDLVDQCRASAPKLQARIEAVINSGADPERLFALNDKLHEAINWYDGAKQGKMPPKPTAPASAPAEPPAAAPATGGEEDLLGLGGDAAVPAPAPAPAPAGSAAAPPAAAPASAATPIPAIAPPPAPVIPALAPPRAADRQCVAANTPLSLVHPWLDALALPACSNRRRSASGAGPDQDLLPDMGGDSSAAGPGPAPAPAPAAAGRRAAAVPADADDFFTQVATQEASTDDGFFGGAQPSQASGGKLDLDALYSSATAAAPAPGNPAAQAATISAMGAPYPQQQRQQQQYYQQQVMAMQQHQHGGFGAAPAPGQGPPPYQPHQQAQQQQQQRRRQQQEQQQQQAPGGNPFDMF